ncbi:MAG: protein kinase domain-containing protein [Anaerolineales bacterium]
MGNISGEVIKGYEILEQIGAGGFGTVYRAQQPALGREVAVKIILPEHANHPEFIRRFEIEAQLVARLEHPHIVPIHDYWRDPSGAYIVMRYLSEGSLQAALQKEAFNLELTARMLDQVSSALALAHRNGVVHCDLKPNNILLDEDGNAYLADFGIAKVLDNLDGEFNQRGMIGSPDYISPEQARGEPVTPQTDIYSLGVVLFEVLTGHHPFSDSTAVERLFKHIDEALPEIKNLDANGNLQKVNAVIQEATAKNPRYRYQDVMEMSIAFREAIGIKTSSLIEQVIEPLTMREQEVLRCMINGQSNQEIANELVIALSTVKWYAKQIYRKLEVRNRVQAISRARELNLVVSESSRDNIPVAASSISTISLPEPNNPYLGLRPFQAVDQRYFFGRENLVETLIKRLNLQNKEFGGRFLAIVGPSGSGKSSLVRAGLIPALWRGELPGSNRWFVVDMLPGTHPLDELEIALLQVAANQAPNLREQLNRDIRGLHRIAQLILPKDDSEMVVIIDQFEEVFTLVEDEAERRHFLDLVYTAVTDPRSRVRVVITLRADFYDRPLHYPDFGELLRSQMETVLPLSAEQLERAIRRPAEQVGVTFEQGLVANIIDDVLYQPGALPLLQYALTELFDQRQGRILTKEAYKKIGGTVGALATRADEIFDDLTPAGQALTRQLFLRLVTLGEGVEDTRRRVPYAELIDLVNQNQVNLTDAVEDSTSGVNDPTSIDLMEDVIEIFTGYRLLSMDHDPGTRIPTVELAHEAILREWDLLRQWIEESREDIREQRNLARATMEWQAAKRDPSFLLRGSRLDLTKIWVEGTDLALTPNECEFLDASLADRQQREKVEAERQAHEVQLEQRSKRFLWALVAVFAFAAVIAALLSGIAFNQSSIAHQNAATATYAQGEALLLADSRATQQSVAEDEAEKRATQQAIAENEVDARATQQAIAEEQSEARAIAEAQAINERNNALEAEQEALKQASIGLASQALAEMQTANSERGVLLALAALQEYPYTPQAEAALARAVQESLPYHQLIDKNGTGLDGHWVDWSPDGQRIAVGATENDVGEHAAVVYDVNTGEIDMVIHLLITEKSGVTMNERCSVQQINWSPDGTRLVLVANNNNLDTPQPRCYYLQVYDAASGDLLMDLDSQGEFAVDWSPDGQLLLTGGEGGSVKLWDANSGELVLEMKGHEKTDFEILPDTSDRILAARFSPDGMYAATFSAGGILHIWETSSGKLMHTFSHPYESVVGQMPYPGMNKIALAWSPGSKRIATAWYDGLGRIWNLESDQVEQILAGHTGNMTGIDWSPDGIYLLTQGIDTSARLWVAATGQMVLNMPTNGFGNTAWSPDSKSMAVPTQKGLLVWDISTLPPVINPSTPIKNRILEAKWTPDGNQLVLSGIDGLVFDWIGDKSSRQIAPNEGYYEFSPDGRRMVVSEGWNKTPPQIIDLQSGEVVTSLKNPDPEVIYPNGSWSNDGLTVASGTYPGFYTVFWDPETGLELARSEAVEGFMKNAQFSPDDSMLAAPTMFAEGNSPIYLIDTRTGKTVQKLPSEDGWSMVAYWSPDGETLAVGYQSGVIKLWDTKTWSVVKKFEAHLAAVWDLCWSPNGQRIISGDDNSQVLVWEVDTGEVVLSWDMQGLLAGGFNDTDWSPDGQFVSIHGTGDIPYIKRVWQSTEELINYAYDCCVWRELSAEEREQFGLPVKE